MGEATIALGLGLGGGKASTSSGRLAGGGAFSNTYSVDFDGTDDYGNTSGSELDLESNFSTSGWYKVVSNLNTGFAWKWGELSDGKRRSLLVYQDVWNFNFYGSGVAGTTTVSLNTWYHVVTTVNSDYTEGKIYVNGSLEQTVDLSSDAAAFTYSSTFVGAQGSSLGRMNVKIDEFAIFSGVLSSSDVTAIYNSGTPADLSSFSPVGWWRMGDGTEAGSGTTVYDMSSNSNNLTLFNGPTYSTDVP